jgi:hypothetical protein
MDGMTSRGFHQLMQGFVESKRIFGNPLTRHDKASSKGDKKCAETGPLLRHGIILAKLLIYSKALSRAVTQVLCTSLCEKSCLENKEVLEAGDHAVVVVRRLLTEDCVLCKVMKVVYYVMKECVTFPSDVWKMDNIIETRSVLETRRHDCRVMSFMVSYPARDPSSYGGDIIPQGKCGKLAIFVAGNHNIK